MRLTSIVVAGLVAVLGAAHDASAQDERWAPWLGCWERVTERVNATSVTGEGSGTVEPEATPAGTAPQVCVAPDAAGGVRVTTTVPGQEPIEQTLVADGKPHPIAEGGCEGTETLEWSRNGQRIFARAEVECTGGTSRTISGLALLTPDDTWLDIRSVRIGDVANTRVSRYQRIEDQPSLRLPRAGSPPLTLDEITEASGQVSEAVIEAALVETNPRLPVRSETLIELVDAGVSPDVVDLIVALAYPDRFVVERTGQIAAVTRTGASGPFGIDDYYYSGFYHPAYYYSPFGYSYIGFYDPFLFGPPYYYRPPRGGGVVPPDDTIRPSGRARAIDGQGYTRIRPADEAQAPSRTARPRPGRTSNGGNISGSSGSTQSSGSSSSGGSSSDGGSSSGGGASPQGYSGGGGGRTAQPR